MALSWRDALKRGRGAAPAAAPVVAAPATVDPAHVSPTLAALLDERAAIEANMAALTGTGRTGTGAAAIDPRYPVVPLAARRAEVAAWTRGRDAVRDTPKASGSTASRTLQAVIGGAADPPLRPTPGETPAGTAAGSAVFAALRDTARQDAGRLIDGAFARTAARVARPLRGEAALARAKTAIADDWRDRARRAIPQLGDEGSYAARAKALLAVAVGSVDQLTDKADRVRDMARDGRDLRDADSAGDDARRDRALDRLRARRQEG